jgi:hypothetical protein
MRWKLLATDFDRTLTDHPHGMNPRVPAALAAAQKAGLRVAICSGQPLRRLRDALPDLDAYAAENGAVVWMRGDDKPWVHPWPERPQVVALLDAASIPHRNFDVVFDIDRAHEGAVRKLLAEAHRARAVPNVDSINLQPVDATKGLALARIRTGFGFAREATVAVGDGENDVALFAEAGLAVAVANATPEAKAAAHRVLALPDGQGVAELIEELLRA